MTEGYRPELPPVPDRMKSLPIRRGYPVPWFVAMVDGDYHFPTADARKMNEALKKNLCWVCGQKLGVNKSFVIGPMCAVNRNTSEPPCHHECAVFAATACPFLARPQMKRSKDIAEGSEAPPGEFITRNPGVACVWTCREFLIRRMERGFLFRIGEPHKVEWFALAGGATREHVMASLQSGLPILRGFAAQEGPRALGELERAYQFALKWVPA